MSDMSKLFYWEEYTKFDWKNGLIESIPHLGCMNCDKELSTSILERDTYICPHCGFEFGRREHEQEA